MTTSGGKLRIACCGLVVAESGSVASAGFEVLQELLCRGHEVDFFSKRSYVYPDLLVQHPGFIYNNCDQPRLDEVVEGIGDEAVQWLAMQMGHAVYSRRVIRTMTRQHRARYYDTQLFLGQWAYGRVPGLPVVSWVQGPPGTDARSIVRHAAQIRSLCGPSEYAKLRAVALYRTSRIGWPPFHHTDKCICGSARSEKTLVTEYGLRSAAVRTLPYPIDLDAFCPVDASATGGTCEMLWVGRVVPRKRLDLFLDAGAHLIRTGVDLHLTVIGTYPFARGYHRLIERFAFPDRLTYLPGLARAEVRRRMQSASVLVQTSEDENFGSSVAEALACGTPVVVGPSNGTAEYIGGGGERFHDYTATSVAHAVGAVLELMRQGSSAVRSAARQAAIDHFAVARIVDRLEEILWSAGRPVEEAHSESVVPRPR